VNKIKLKKINKTHKVILYKWHKLKSVTKNSLKGKKANIVEHNKWFTKQLLSKNLIKLIYIGKIPVGVIRLEKKNSFYLISYMVAPKYRRRGIAYKAIKQLISNLKKKKIKKVVAIVKKNNIPSLKIFDRLKFKKISNFSNKNFFKFNYKI
tara:strand:- start:600 stop:1052 length:453 start_codon:yes stop_codon:yes gene_type:complete